MLFELVDTKDELKQIEFMASIIWPIAYKDILSADQIKYMLNKYLTLDAILANIDDGYTYVIIHDEDNKMGFMSYKLMDTQCFLSKLYILPNFQNQGIARKAIEYLQAFKLPITLTVNKHNDNAYQKYLHMGFTVYDSVVTDIGNGYVMDDYCMVLKKD
ncbi:MAG: GNAT family N-acetyltransferase [Acholeplasmatales bacterium]|nr:GNAT family N-acetyltransferase [Acholeplasmatales bacterium]